MIRKRALLLYLPSWCSECSGCFVFWSHVQYCSISFVFRGESSCCSPCGLRCSNVPMTRLCVMKFIIGRYHSQAWTRQSSSNLNELEMYHAVPLWMAPWSTACFSLIPVIRVMIDKFLPQQHASVQQVHSGIEVRLHQVGTGTGYRYVYGS